MAWPTGARAPLVSCGSPSRPAPTNSGGKASRTPACSPVPGCARPLPIPTYTQHVLLNPPRLSLRSRPHLRTSCFPRPHAMANRMQPRVLLERYRNSMIAFVGDSLNDNLVASFRCTLAAATPFQVRPALPGAAAQVTRLSAACCCTGDAPVCWFLHQPITCPLPTHYLPAPHRPTHPSLPPLFFPPLHFPPLLSPSFPLWSPALAARAGEGGGEAVPQCSDAAGVQPHPCHHRQWQAHPPRQLGTNGFHAVLLSAGLLTHPSLPPLLHYSSPQHRPTHLHFEGEGGRAVGGHTAAHSSHRIHGWPPLLPPGPTSMPCMDPCLVIFFAIRCPWHRFSPICLPQSQPLPIPSSLSQPIDHPSQNYMSPVLKLRKSLKAVRDYIERTNYPGVPLFVSYSPAHDRAQCQTAGTPLNNITAAVAGGDTRAMACLKEQRKLLARSRMRLVEITYMSMLRPDGHLNRGVSGRRKDCSHWCLPGVPDAWTNAIYSMLVA
ncbi:unnamed protein product [Closterium sp. NIES-54]